MPPATVLQAVQSPLGAENNVSVSRDTALLRPRTSFRHLNTNCVRRFSSSRLVRVLEGRLICVGRYNYDVGWIAIGART